jgi:nucleotide-binding universal stress UspA family protein
MGVDQRREEDAQVALQSAADKAPEGVAVKRRVLWGDAPSALQKLAAEEADLLIAGSRGFGSLHRAMAGSISGALLSEPRVPTLITPRVVVRAAAVA